MPGNSGFGSTDRIHELLSDLGVPAIGLAPEEGERENGHMETMRTKVSIQPRRKRHLVCFILGEPNIQYSPLCSSLHAAQFPVVLPFICHSAELLQIQVS